MRIFTDCSKAKHPLSKKFGASLHTCRGLLEQAKELGLDVIGVSFHVGSGCIDPEAFSLAITDAHLVFQTAVSPGSHYTFQMFVQIWMVSVEIKGLILN